MSEPTDTPPAPVPHVPGHEEAFTLAEMTHATRALRSADQPVGTRRRKTLMPLLVTAGVILTGITGMGAYIAGRHSPTRAPAAAVAPSKPPSSRSVNEVECVDVERAYRAWSGDLLPRTPTQVRALNALAVALLVDDGKEFLNAVTGYADKPSKELALAVAAYNFELGLVNLTLTIGGRIQPEAPDKVAAAVADVLINYEAFHNSMCAS